VVEGAATLATLGVRVSSLLASDLAIARRRHSMKIAGHGTRLAAVLAGSKFSRLAASTRGEAAFTAAGLACRRVGPSVASKLSRKVASAGRRSHSAGRTQVLEHQTVYPRGCARSSAAEPGILAAGPALRTDAALFPQGPQASFSPERAAARAAGSSP
jgi:hypothetical protein